MAETSLWAYLKKGMKEYWNHATRVENVISKGMADVSYYHGGNGWIELKEVKKLPARATTGVKLGQWHDLCQRHFLIKRCGWLLIRVNYPNRCYLLFDCRSLPPDEKPLWTWTELQDNAIYVWRNRIDFMELQIKLGYPE